MHKHRKNAHHMEHKGVRDELEPSLELMPALVIMPRPQRAVTRTTTLQAKTDRREKMKDSKIVTIRSPRIHCGLSYYRGGDSRREVSKLPAGIIATPALVAST